MTTRTWLITGVSSGFGRQLTEQILQRGEIVVGTVRDLAKVDDLVSAYPGQFYAEQLDVRDTAALRDMVTRALAQLGHLDVVISNAGYGLFGAAEELSDSQIDAMISTNLLGSIQLIRAVLPIMRGQGHGRIIQLSSYGGQVAFAGNSLYHATKWGIEGFVESVAQEVASFGIGMTIVEPGGARTEFRYGSAQVASLMSEYDTTPAHAFRRMPSCACWTQPTASRLAIRHAWRHALSNRLTCSRRRCAWFWARRPYRTPSRHWKNDSPTSPPRRRSRPPLTSHLANNGPALSMAASIHTLVSTGASIALAPFFYPVLSLNLSPSLTTPPAPVPAGPPALHDRAHSARCRSTARPPGR